MKNEPFQWILVKDRLPPKQRLVLLHEKKGRTVVGYYGAPHFNELYFWVSLTGWITDEYPTTDVTHWMFIEPPDGVKLVTQKHTKT